MSKAVQRQRTRLGAATTLSVAVALMAAGAAIAGPASADQGSTTTLPGTSPNYATASADLGQTAAGTKVTARVFLAGRDDAGLATYAKNVSDPMSAVYKQFLSAAQVQQRFGATPQQISAVTQWLRSSGLSVTSTTAHWIDVSGPAAAVQKAFATPLHDYKTATGTSYAPQHDAKIPNAVAGAVAGVSGLSQAASHAKTTSVRASATGDGSAASNPNCSAYYGEKLPQAGLPPVPAGYENPTYLSPCSYVPSQLRGAYGVTKAGLTGKGATIAIVNWYASSTMLADANQYSTNHGDKPFAPGQYSAITDPSQWTALDQCGGGDTSEESLDVEMAHGLAPDSKVITVAANSCVDNDLLAAEAKIVDGHLADIVSNSWGESVFTTQGDLPPSVMQAYDKIFMQGAAEGIAFDFSSGDCMNNNAYSVATGLNCDPTVSRAQTD